MLGVRAWADYTEGYYEYVLGDHCVEITGYFGDEEETEIPARIAGYPVCIIRSGAFADADSLSVITLPDTIMEIQDGAFSAEQTIVYTSPPVISEEDAGGQGTGETGAGSEEAPIDETENSEAEEAPMNVPDTAADSKETPKTQNDEAVAVTVTPEPGQVSIEENAAGSEELEFDDQTVLKEQGTRQETKAAETEIKPALNTSQEPEKEEEKTGKADTEANFEEETETKAVKEMEAAHNPEEETAAITNQTETVNNRSIIIGVVIAIATIVCGIMVIKKHKDA